MKRVGIVAQHVAAPQEYDIVIRNGTIFDGLRTPRFLSDIGIKNGKTATIGRISKEAKCKTEIDATGLNVCPGFIDLHTHYDAQLFWDPYLTMSGWHGITSVIVGNCGFGYAPCKPDNRIRAMQTLERNEAIPYEAQAAGMPWDWETYPEMLDSIDRTAKGVNIMSYFGIAPCMTYFMGLENARKRPATADEMDQMKECLREAMEAGACGFSVQKAGKFSAQRDFDGEPMCTDTMSNEDLYAFGSVLSEIGSGFIQVAGPSMKSTENLAKASGRPILYNAVAPATDQHGSPLEQHTILLKWLDRVNKEQGLRIFGQAICQDGDLTFSLDNFNLFDIYPEWKDVTVGSVEQRIAAMTAPKTRQALLDLHDAGRGPLAVMNTSMDGERDLDRHGEMGITGSTSAAKETMADGIKKMKREDPQNNADSLFLVNSPTGKFEKYKGMKLVDIAKAENKNMVDCMLDMSIAEDLKTSWKTGKHDDHLAFRKGINEIVNHPYTCSVGLSDGGAHCKFLTLGEWPTRLLSEVVRNDGMMSLEDAHWKMAKYPAQASGMLDRGSIAVGMPADIICYDLKNLKLLSEEVLYDQPGGEWRRANKADGYRYTIVNGEVTFIGNKCTGATPGRLLRHGRAQDLI